MLIGLTTPVIVKDVSELADTLKELKLFIQKAVHKQPREPPAALALAASAAALQPNTALAAAGSLPPWKQGPPVCDYCKEPGHMRNQCKDFKTDWAAAKVTSWGRAFFWPD